MKKEFKMNKIIITLTRYNETDDLVYQTLTSLSKQKNIIAEILFFDQNYNPEYAERIQNLSHQNINFTIINTKPEGLSRARNLAIKMAKEKNINIVLYIDPDAIANPNWAYELSKELNNDNCAITGSRIIPKWTEKPLIIAQSSIVKEQYSLLDLGEENFETQKVVGASFGINIETLGKEAFFEENFGRKNGNLLGGEETDLCQRAKRQNLKIKYCGKSLIQHVILPERIKYSWIAKRFYAAGYSRSQRKGNPEPFSTPKFIDYLLILPIIPFYINGWIKSKKNEIKNENKEKN